jgi:hypothetical protein
MQKPRRACAPRSKKVRWRQSTCWASQMDSWATRKFGFHCPDFLEDAAKILKSLGQGKRVDELVTSMNRAAEAAVPMARDLLVNAVKSMNVNDARKILGGGDTSVTISLLSRTREPLAREIPARGDPGHRKSGLAEKYNRIASKAAGLGLVKKEDANIQQYVTGKSLDGLYLMIGEEEKKIRQDPVGTGSACCARCLAR